MGLRTFLLDFVRPRRPQREKRDPAAEALMDAIRKLVFGVLILFFGYIFYYATTNFWDVVINLNDALEAIAHQLGIS